MHRSPILAYFFGLTQMSVQTFTLPKPLQVNSVESQSRFSSAPSLSVRSEHSFSTVFVPKSWSDLRTAWISYFPRVGPCNLDYISLKLECISLQIIGICEQIRLRNTHWCLTSDLFHYSLLSAVVVVVKLAPAPPIFVSRSHDTYFKLHLHDKVSSFINQFLQVLAVQGHQTLPAGKTHHALRHQGCMNCLELLTCP